MIDNPHFEERFELVTLENTTQRIWAHKVELCVHDPCPIHKRSDHRMRSWPQKWRTDRYLMERLCEHNIGHPDPDDVEASWNGVHGCDGCCRSLPGVG